MIDVLALARIANREPNANMKSVVLGLEKHPAGLDQPHRLAHYLAQIAHESGGWRYDREVWGPTPAQKRYDTRTDLGNTPQADGDGYRFRGRTGIQITGRANTKEFLDWCRKHVDHTGPDFVADPDAMNTDPWEGLGPIWYWDTRNLNPLADRNDISGITQRINGGLNGFKDRKKWYVRSALVLLGYNPTDIIGFQRIKGLSRDGIAGPETMGALHAALKAMTPSTGKVAAQTGAGVALTAAFLAIATKWAELQAWLASLFGG